MKEVEQMVQYQMNTVNVEERAARHEQEQMYLLRERDKIENERVSLLLEQERIEADRYNLSQHLYEAMQQDLMVLTNEWEERSDRYNRRLASFLEEKKALNEEVIQVESIRRSERTAFRRFIEDDLSNLWNAECFVLISGILATIGLCVQTLFG